MRPVGVPCPLLARLAEAHPPAIRRSGQVASHGYADLVPGKPPRPLAVSSQHLALGRERVALLVDLDVADEHDAVLDALENGEQLRHPVWQGRGRPPVRPGHSPDALVGEHLEEELRPIRDWQLAAVEYGPRGRREPGAARMAQPPPEAVRVVALLHYVGGIAERARFPRVGVEELSLPLEGRAGVPVPVDVAVAGRHHRLGGADRGCVRIVPRCCRWSLPASPAFAHDGGPCCSGRARRQGPPRRESIAPRPSVLANTENTLLYCQHYTESVALKPAP